MRWMRSSIMGATLPLVMRGKTAQGKYLVQDRIGRIYESAQFLYVLVAASLFAHYPAETDGIHKTVLSRSICRKLSLPTQSCPEFARPLVGSLHVF